MLLKFVIFILPLYFDQSTSKKIKCVACAKNLKVGNWKNLNLDEEPCFGDGRHVTECQAERCAFFLSIKKKNKTLGFWRLCMNRTNTGPDDLNYVGSDKTDLVIQKFSSKAFGNCGTANEVIGDLKVSPDRKFTKQGKEFYEKVIGSWTKDACKSRKDKNSSGYSDDASDEMGKNKKKKTDSDEDNGHNSKGKNSKENHYNEEDEEDDDDKDNNKRDNNSADSDENESNNDDGEHDNEQQPDGR
ncbi:hypothetical protein HELRODRAFT_174647 [Helobdella robusta]|uniref:Uncharacterized protein n=1 Tax=Helobdella robusta TaxID=6412 RepID=T1F8C5_HELRO|nr:hypothetical protein HELRODRAFT_174647 [Helobdella robusta]ESO01683.1 hypothetical protein HELRODRAFT_174647 [Helobdella robusta]